jgi:hypothetical protein
MNQLLAALALLALAVAPAWAENYSDPIAYCRAVGTIDRPDTRYTGRKLPDWMATRLGLKPDQDKMMEWRCAGGVVLACLYGANIPCDAKADTRRRPTTAIRQFCREHQDSDFVPMYVTGHSTVVSWACRGARPVVTRVGGVDAQGYAKAYWHPVER